MFSVGRASRPWESMLGIASSLPALGWMTQGLRCPQPVAGFLGG
jgi:hypothetical protein